MDQSVPEPPRLESLHIRNFRALRDFRLEGLTPFTVLLGPNGSGKSTVLDALRFLKECFETRLEKVWAMWGSARSLRSRGSAGPIAIELGLRRSDTGSLSKYHLEIDEADGLPVVLREEFVTFPTTGCNPKIEILRVQRSQGHDDIHVLPGLVATSPGASSVTAGASPVFRVPSNPHTTIFPWLPALREYPDFSKFCGFIDKYAIIALVPDAIRGVPDAQAERRLSRDGNNLPNVLQFLMQEHPDRLAHVIEELRAAVPGLDNVVPIELGDGRITLRVKDKAFTDPAHARDVSDGTLKLLACLVVLNDPNPPSLIGLEEPENFIYPKLLHELGEKCRAASAHSQIIATTHSPQFLNALRPEEVRILWRDATGYTQSKRASDIPAVRAMMDAGALMGDLWMEGYLEDFPAADGGA